jgi:hypothetical protein
VKETTAQAKAMEKGVPTAKVVLLAHAQHRVFQSNSADVPRGDERLDGDSSVANSRSRARPFCLWARDR